MLKIIIINRPFILSIFQKNNRTGERSSIYIMYVFLQVFFWAPTIKWCLIGAGLADLARPANKLSASQNTALAATGKENSFLFHSFTHSIHSIAGFIWTRYCLAITPINYYLSSVNFFVGCTGLTQLIRIAHYRYFHPEIALNELLNGKFEVHKS